MAEHVAHVSGHDVHSLLAVLPNLPSTQEVPQVLPSKKLPAVQD
jgi:hypothetical protein